MIETKHTTESSSTINVKNELMVQCFHDEFEIEIESVTSKVYNSGDGRLLCDIDAIYTLYREYEPKGSATVRVYREGALFKGEDFLEVDEMYSPSYHAISIESIDAEDEESREIIRRMASRAPLTFVNVKII